MELIELTNSVLTVSDDKIQITILILRRGALSRLSYYSNVASLILGLVCLFGSDISGWVLICLFVPMGCWPGGSGGHIHK